MAEDSMADPAGRKRARGRRTLLAGALTGGLALVGGYGAQGHDGPHAADAHQAPDHEVRVSVREGYRYIESNGMPDHEFGPFPNRGNPNEARPQRQAYRVTTRPEKAEKPVPTRVFGVAVNGVIFEPGTAETWLDRPETGWRYDALSGKLDLGMDRNHAHVQPTGRYHYHGLPTGLIEALGGDQDRMLLIGYAADGFPIYTSKGYAVADKPESGVKPLRSSYKRKPGKRPNGPGGTYDGTFVEDYEYVAGSGDLDECNGRTGVTPEHPEGTYYYVLTTDFPFVPRLLRGSPDPSFQQGGPPGMARAGGPPPGGRGGPPGMGPGGPRGPRQAGLSGLLQDPRLAEELGLNAEQRQALRETGRPGGGPPGRPGGGDPAQREAEERRIVERLRGTLEPEQVRRLEQIRLQAAGPEKLLRADVARELGLTEDQEKRVREMLAGPWADGIDLGAGAGGIPTLPAFMRFHRQVEQRMNERVAEVLTEAQKAKLDALLGEPFETAGGPPRGPGRAPGGNGRPGPD